MHPLLDLVGAIPGFGLGYDESGPQSASLSDEGYAHIAEQLLPFNVVVDDDPASWGDEEGFESPFYNQDHDRRTKAQVLAATIGTPHPNIKLVTNTHCKHIRDNRDEIKKRAGSPQRNIRAERESPPICCMFDYTLKSCKRDITYALMRRMPSPSKGRSQKRTEMGVY